MSGFAGIHVAVRADRPGEGWWIEDVLPTDLDDVIAETVFEGFVRRGRASAPTHLRFAVDSGRGALRVEAWDEATGARSHRDFSPRSLEHVVLRAVERALAPAGDEEGEGEAQKAFHYEVRQRIDARTDHVLPARPPLPPTVVAPLAPLLDAADTAGRGARAEFPVFYTDSALATAESCARLGSAFDPPVETGALLAATLCSAAETGEFFAVVHDAFDAVDAESSAFALEFTARTWSRFRQDLARLRAARPHARCIGQAHGHNWRPEADDPSVSSVFASTADAKWSRVVFQHQPYRLCHVFGTTADGERDQCLYGLRDGRLRPRQFHVISDATAEETIG